MNGEDTPMRLTTLLVRYPGATIHVTRGENDRHRPMITAVIRIPLPDRVAWQTETAVHTVALVIEEGELTERTADRVEHVLATRLAALIADGPVEHGGHEEIDRFITGLKF